MKNRPDNKRLLAALASVSSVSVAAKKLADQLISESNTELVAQLHAKITELEAKIFAMTVDALPDQSDLTEEESNVLTSSFNSRIKASLMPELMGFDRRYLADCEPSVRLVIATSLRNRSVELGQTPMDIWLDIIALGGELK